MQSKGPVSDAHIDSYHDGNMSPSQQEEFQAHLDRDPALRAQVDCQKWIDEALRQWCDESQVDTLLPRIETALAEAHEAFPRRLASLGPLRLLAAAAIVGLSLTGVWYSWERSGPRPARNVYQPQPWRSFAAVYYDTIQDGFKPAWVCRNEKQFETAFTRQFQQPVLLAALPAGVTAGGISYSNSMTPGTINVLGRVNGVPVMVFVDRLSADVGPLPPPPPELHLFRSELDSLVLYELTPLDRPEILPFFYNPGKK